MCPAFTSRSCCLTLSQAIVLQLASSIGACVNHCRHVSILACAVAQRSHVGHGLSYGCSEQVPANEILLAQHLAREFEKALLLDGLQHVGLRADGVDISLYVCRAVGYGKGAVANLLEVRLGCIRTFQLVGNLSCHQQNVGVAEHGQVHTVVVGRHRTGHTFIVVLAEVETWSRGIVVTQLGHCVTVVVLVRHTVHVAALVSIVVLIV